MLFSGAVVFNHGGVIHDQKLFAAPLARLAGQSAPVPIAVSRRHRVPGFLFVLPVTASSDASHRHNRHTKISYAVARRLLPPATALARRVKTNGPFQGRPSGKDQIHR